MAPLSSYSFKVLPFAAFAFGLIGSLHCVSMCGVFATSCSRTNENMFCYQLGRVVSYSGLGLLFGSLGASFHHLFKNSMLQHVPVFVMSIFFIYLGVSHFTQKKISLRLPDLVEKRLCKLLSISYSLPNGNLRALFIGLMSSLLPCGLLYSTVISLTVFQGPLVGFVGMFFFALGTIPCLVISPVILRRAVGPIKNYLPRAISSLALISLGFITIFYRAYSIYGTTNCH